MSVNQQISGSLSGQFEEADRQKFMDDCAFAKVVETVEGEALLIGDKAVRIYAPRGISARWLAEALRSNGLARLTGEGSDQS